MENKKTEIDIILPNYNSLEFIDSINFLIDNDKEAEIIANNGFEFAKKTYDPKKIAKQYIDVYNKYLIGKNG